MWGPRTYMISVFDERVPFLWFSVNVPFGCVCVGGKGTRTKTPCTDWSRNRETERGRETTMSASWLGGEYTLTDIESSSTCCESKMTVHRYCSEWDWYFPLWRSSLQHTRGQPCVVVHLCSQQKHILHIDWKIKEIIYRNKRGGGKEKGTLCMRSQSINNHRSTPPLPPEE